MIGESGDGDSVLIADPIELASATPTAAGTATVIRKGGPWRMWSAAIKAAIEASPIIAPMLARWDYGDGVRRPAIFVGEVPIACGAPRISLSESGVDRYDTRGYRGGRVVVQVTIYGDKALGVSGLGSLAHSVWRLINRRAVAVDGYRSARVLATPPSQIEDVDGFPGWTFPAEITILEVVQ